MKRTTWTGFCLVAGLGLLAAIAVGTTASQPTGKGRKVYKNSVVPLPVKGPVPHGLVVNVASDEHKEDKLDVLFSLAIPPEAQAKLEGKVLKGEVIEPKDLLKDYSPRPEDAERLTKWLKEEGFELTNKTADNTGVYARGTVGQIEKSLQVKMARVTHNGLTYNAARNAPSLPEDVGASVQTIMGLQPFRQATKKSRLFHRPAGFNPAVANAPPYLVKEILKAYDADALTVTGDKQKIAILIDTAPTPADMDHFWKKNNIPPVADRLTTIKVKGNSVELPAPTGEESMDAQWTSGIAPGAKVRLYASVTLQFVDLDLALDRILADAMADPELRQVSISLGLGEKFLSPDGSLDGEVLIEHQKFLQLAAIGVNVFVSSGDGGSNPDQFGQAGGEDQVEFMASSPFVVAVGGTVLKLNPGTGAVASETGWPGSGGGVSAIFPRPSFQTGTGIPQGQKRLVPDVGLIASPETGVYVRLNGQDQQIGGTSLSAPVWAGFCARINEARTKANKPRLTFLNPLIYPLAGTDCFRDIQGGSNGKFEATKDYDMVTGIGVPNMKNLVPKLSQ